MNSPLKSEQLQSTPIEAVSATRHREFSPSEEYFVSHREALLAEYRNQYIAMRDGEMIAHANSRRVLEEKLFKRDGERRSALVKFVTEESFDLEKSDTTFIF